MGGRRATRPGAADVIIGDDAAYTDVPFFWSVHFDVRIRFVGYAGSHDDRTLIGDLASDGAVFYRRQGAIVAAATVGKRPARPRSGGGARAGDQESLERMGSG